MNNQFALGAILSGYAPNDYLYTTKDGFLKDLDTVMVTALIAMYLDSPRELRYKPELISVDISDTQIFICFSHEPHQYTVALNALQIAKKIKKQEDIQQEIHFATLQNVRPDITVMWPGNNKIKLVRSPAKSDLPPDGAFRTLDQYLSEL